MADFAPYQSAPPDYTRALSPPLRSPNASPPVRGSSPYTPVAATVSSAPGYQNQNQARPPMPGAWGDDDVDVYTTRLGLRLGVEAALAYLCFPPVGGIVLLVVEGRSDYVRFHAWQSTLVFGVLFVVHLLFSWSRLLGWLFFLFELMLAARLAWRAYTDAATLDRYEVPFFGPLASSVLDDE
ncbi:UPF0132 domain-containing protein [Trichodelitschia bisporula]|uniref:UPF0132 domain-containing protein n=1 Tax=Trichodelitschia bisporula TaxID=703511 RepID=A0A6G1HR91_9PEZI|nr:UPF0132 domain-containing protein [Trichodelitschia bisporula]